MFCTKCGKQLNEGAAFCVYCGAQINSDEINSTQEPKVPQQSAVISKKKSPVLLIACVCVVMLVIAVTAGLLFFGKKNESDATEEAMATEKEAVKELLQETDAEDTELQEEANVQDDTEVKEAVPKTAEKEAIEEVIKEESTEGKPKQPGEVVLGNSSESEASQEKNKKSLKDEAVSEDAESGTESREYLLPGSDETYISMSDLKGFSAEDCRIARNEIYARHGRKFNDEALQSYFNDKGWYQGTINPDDFNENMLNEYEKANRDLIVEYEKKSGYR